jgi:hypothetical protein
LWSRFAIIPGTVRACGVHRESGERDILALVVFRNRVLRFDDGFVEKAFGTAGFLDF